jgi:hypothetical protein
MNQKTSFVMSAIVITAALALALAVTTSITGAYADEPETNTEQKIRQENLGSGQSININCGQNLINSDGDIVCFDPTVNVTDDE